jgi:hypothetical protein
VNQFNKVLVFSLLVIFTLSSVQCTSQVSSRPRRQGGIEFYGEEKRVFPEINDPYEADPKAILKRSLYLDPYLIFQSTLGEKPSDFYLMALNTDTSTLHKIHQGYHRRFWIQEQKLIFQHASKHFACKWEAWDQVKAIPDPGSSVPLKDRHSSLKKEVPSLLRSINLERIHCIMEGSFTRPHQRELLFISSYPKGYQLGVYQLNQKAMTLSASLSIDREDYDKESTYPAYFYRQAMAQDMDGDGCLELFIAGVNLSQNYQGDPLLYIDLSAPAHQQEVQQIALPLDDKGFPLSSPRLVRKSPREVQVTFALTDPLQAQETHLYKLQYQANTGSMLVFNRQEAYQPYPKDHHPRHQDFISTAHSLKLTELYLQPVSSKHPQVSFPSLYKDSASSETEEKVYHRQRNQATEAFIRKLDASWNPFQEVKERRKEAKEPELLLSTWVSLADLIPVLEGQRWLYALSFVFQDSKNCEWMICLYDDAFKLIDVWCPLSYDYSTVCPEVFSRDAESEGVKVLLPLPGERTALILYPQLLSDGRYQAIKFSTQGIKSIYRNSGFDWRLLPYRKEMKLEAFSRERMKPEWNTDLSEVSVSYLSHMDPFTGDPMPMEFSYRSKEHLDELYLLLPFFDWKYLPEESFNSRKPPIIKLIEAYEAN